MIPVPALPERILLDLRTECNLACPMCLLHGAPDTPEKEAAIGKMSVEQARQILDTFQDAKPLVQPAFWGEPTLAKDFREHIRQLKAGGFPVAMNTNGLTLRDDLAEFLVAEQVDAVFFSLDSVTPETLQKVRGVDKLAKIEAAIFRLMAARNRAGSLLPRIGATFTIQEANRHELDAFINRWVGCVDVVRVGAVFEEGRLLGVEVPEQRKPCSMIWQTMPIHADGDVSLCCYDSHKRAVMGNVFRDGVAGVWHGEKFTAARRAHETGDYDALPFCRDCNGWVYHEFAEEVTERNGVKVLIRRSPQFTYYNRIDRLDSWHDRIKGHKLPDRDKIDAA